jgi:DNA-binding transcriptional ArsR family regulator
MLVTAQPHMSAPILRLRQALYRRKFTCNRVRLTARPRLVKAAALAISGGSLSEMSVALSPPFLDLLTRRLEAIAEPNRIRILAHLEQQEATVQQLTDELATTHQNVSKHLGVLRDAGIVMRRRDGNKVWYSLADYSACKLIEHAKASLTGYVEELVVIAGLEGTA